LFDPRCTVCAPASYVVPKVMAVNWLRPKNVTAKNYRQAALIDECSLRWVITY